MDQQTFAPGSVHVGDTERFQLQAFAKVTGDLIARIRIKDGTGFHQCVDILELLNYLQEHNPSAYEADENTLWGDICEGAEYVADDSVYIRAALAAELLENHYYYGKWLAIANWLRRASQRDIKRRLLS
jgi:hypothetical protein